MIEDYPTGMIRFLLVAFFSVTIPISASAGWQDDLSALLTAEKPGESARLIKRVFTADPDMAEVTAFLRKIEFSAPAVCGDFMERTRTCSDGVERPYLTYVPGNYDPAARTPLLVYLHGGVSREKILEERLEYARENPFIPVAAENGWLVVFPFGQEGATWWDEVGMDNVLDIVRRTKRDFNVDDDRTWMTGFSDGASASYLFSMLQPDYFAAFAPLNGHMGVGALDGKLPLYAENLGVSPLYVVNTDIDGLYPAERMKLMVDMARRAGGDIFYREYHGIGHDLAYADSELPRIARFFTRHPRDPFPAAFEWRAASSDFGRFRWFGIDRISTKNAEDWHTDANVSLVDARVTFGFFNDHEFKGDGVKVTSLVENEGTLASKMGLQAGDLIVRCGAMEIKDIDDLNDYKQSIERGDRVEVAILRENVEIVLTGRLPDPANYYLFPRDRPSSAVKVSFRANTVFIESSRLERFTLFVHPDMFHLDREIKIVLDGREVYNRLVAPDIEFLLTNFLENRDRSQLYVAAVTIDIE